MMDIVNRRLVKELLWPIKWWDVSHWEYARDSTEHHNVSEGDHFTKETLHTSLIWFNEWYQQMQFPVLQGGSNMTGTICV